MGFKRKHSRVDVGRVGRLQRGSLSAPCKVLDVSESGVRLESRLFVKRGDGLQLLIELEGGRSLTCELEVIHVRTPKLGAKIIYITAPAKLRYERLKQRKEQKDGSINFKAFLAQEQEWTEINIPKFGKQADYKITNEGSVKSIYKQIDSIVNKERYK